MSEPTCPVCGAAGRRDRPGRRVLDSTCTGCGWHFTSDPPETFGSQPLLEQLLARANLQGERQGSEEEIAFLYEIVWETWPLLTEEQKATVHKRLSR